ncbi:hypothetical protein CASFOL_013723 [Castilleja foliolosa]|uniref:Exonuclease domain-containing protein n=1 Tax=Castilleja foliolosa TaxID=1961234 RepID=A0ABD3DKU9_9LAMI
MDELIASTKKEVLVEIVKLAQKRGMQGNKGDWKDFLKSYDKKFGSSLSDPLRRCVDSLVAFIKSFEQDDDVKFFKKVLECHANRNEAAEQFKNISPDKETAEQRLVRLTLEHPLYPTEFSFPSYEEEWVVVKKCLKKSKAMKSTKLLAIDCEMVLCEDGTDALVRVCGVDRNLKVKIDEVVNPNKPIADYRSDITGMSAKDLDGVTCSLKDVQISLKKMLSHGTILVGHSVNNDLQALKLDHTKVIDTSYIFKFAHTNRKPSLSLLCKAKLGDELRKDGRPHNCMDDACAAMKLALARLEGKIDDEITEEVKELDTAKLFVHRIPTDIFTNDLKNILPGDCTIEVIKKAKKTYYSANAIFKNQQEAFEAFEKLKGDLEKDKIGRPQKLVNFDLGSGKTGYVFVCLREDPVEHGTKRSAEDDTPCGIPKKFKTEELEDPNQCEMHLKEIERLNSLLKQRDEEILTQMKLIASLIRKLGL